MERWSGVVLAGLLGVGMLLTAQALPAQLLDRPGIGFTGTVVSADSFALVVRADNGKLVTFPIDDLFRVPAGLVPGTRVTVRYEVVKDNRYRLIGVKIASGPMEHDSTTEPPSMSPAPPTAPDAIQQEPGRSPVLPEPQPEPETEEPTPEPTAAAAAAPRTAVAEARAAALAPALDASLPAARTDAADALPATPVASPPGSREIATLLTLLIASGALLWLALARL